MGADVIEREFGARVLELAREASEKVKLDPAAPKLPKEARMRQTIEHLRTVTDRDVLALVAADKLDNARALHTDEELHGPGTWKRFNAPREQQAAYYTEIASVLRQHDPESRLIAQLVAQVETLFKTRISP